MDILQWVIQGGAVGLAAYAIYAYLETSKNHTKITGNHIDHNTNALINLTEVLSRLDQFLKDKIK